MSHVKRDLRILRMTALLVLAALVIGLPMFIVIAVDSSAPLTSEEQSIVGEWTGQHSSDDRAVLHLTFAPNRKGLFEDGSRSYRAHWSICAKSLNLEYEAVSNAWSIPNRVLASLSRRGLKSDKVMFEVDSLSDDEFRLTKNREFVMHLHRKGKI